MSAGYGVPFPPLAQREILRLAERLALVKQPIAEQEAECDALVLRGAVLTATVAPKGRKGQAALKIATLTRLKGIGSNDATVLTHEFSYRKFRNRRELAGIVSEPLWPVPAALPPPSH